MKTFGLIGAGGFGREVMPLVARSRPSEDAANFCFVVEGEPDREFINGFPVLAMERFLALPGEREFNIAIGDSAARERISVLLLGEGCVPVSIVAGNSIQLDANQVGEGVILCPFTTITSNAVIGRFFHSNIYSYVAHDCVVGDFVTFAPGVKCNGNVVIEDHAYIGTGAVIKQGGSGKPVVIGRGAVVGMGAVVTKDVAPFTTVVGNPARPMERTK